MAKEIHFSYSGIFPKEASNSTDADSIVDIVEGKEPGCCRDSIIVAGDSYDDIASFINPVKRSDKVDDDGANEDRLINILREKRPASRTRSNKVTIIGEHLNEIILVEPKAESSIDIDTFLPEKSLEGQDSDCQQSSPPPSIQNEDRNSVTDSSGPDWHCEEWRQHRKHVFILSCSGKPIYTRYGDADQQASLFGTLLTLSQFLQHSQNNQSNKDVLRCIFAGSRRIVFVPSDLMVMVIVSQSAPGQLEEPTHSLVLQLTYVYNQIVSVLSLSRLKAVYEQRPNFDLRRLLSGSEKFIDSLLKVMNSDPGFLLCSVKCLALENSLRESVAQNIFAHTKIKDLVFAVLMTEGQLVALVRMKQFLLHPIDLHILFNLVNSSESFKQAESWSPVCLPKFDPNGYLHCHISYLDDDSQVCLLLLSVNKDMFYTLSECRKRIRERLIKANSLQSIKQALVCKTKDPGIPELLHFIYKARSTGQFIESDPACPYDTEEEKERLFSIFRYVFCLMHTPGRRLKIYYHSGDKEAVLGWITSGFELFAVFSPFTSKNSAIQLVNKLLKWIKKEENKFFILNSHTF